MAKPWIHAKSSAKKFGGKPEDYLHIHNFLDSSKAVIGDNRHRALTHNSWFVAVVLEAAFGSTFINSDEKTISVRDIGEQHVFEDLGCIPSGQDFLNELEFKPWMEGRGKPPGYGKGPDPMKNPGRVTVFNWNKD